jgi:hypothetical protein
MAVEEGRWIALRAGSIAHTPSGEQRVFDAWDNPQLFGDSYTLWESELTPEEIAALDAPRPCPFCGASSVRPGHDCN